MLKHRNRQNAGFRSRAVFASRRSIAWGLVLLTCSTAWAARSKKLSAGSFFSRSELEVQIIGGRNSAPDDAKHHKVAKHGGPPSITLAAIKADAYSAPAGALSALANDPDVRYVSADRPLNGTLDNSVAAVKASAAWKAGWSGAGIAIAVIDSGITTISDLDSIGSLGPGPRVLYSHDFVDAKGNSKDKYGHGTHVAGIIAGNAAASSCPNCDTQLQGVAPNARILNFHALDQNGEGTDTSVINAIYQAIAVKDQYNIRVMNLSVGRPVYESYKQDPLCQAVEMAWKAGIVVVVAAGNDGRDNSFGNNGYGTINAPGNDPYVITVGAMNTMGTPDRSDDIMASYSSKGPTAIDHIVKPDIVAPGNKVISLQAQGSTLVTTYPDNVPPVGYYFDGNGHRPSPNYFTLSGTSMSTPVVSGAVADLLQAKPGLTPGSSESSVDGIGLQNIPISSNVVDPATGENYVSYYDLFTVGAGYLDLEAALASLDQVPTGGNALSPVANYDAAAGYVSLSYDPSSVWAAGGFGVRARS